MFRHTLILHIGAPRTGTTSFQLAIATDAHRLTSVHLCKFCLGRPEASHNSLAPLLNSIDTRPKAISRLIGELSETNSDVLITAEGLMSLELEAIEALLTAIPPEWRVRIVWTSRNAVKLAYSTYAHWVRVGCALSPQEAQPDIESHLRRVLLVGPEQWVGISLKRKDTERVLLEYPDKEKDSQWMLELAVACNLNGLRLPDLETNRSPSWRLTQLQRRVNSLLAEAADGPNSAWIRPRELPWRVHEVLTEFLAEDGLSGIADINSESFNELPLMNIDKEVKKRNIQWITNMAVDNGAIKK